MIKEQIFLNTVYEHNRTGFVCRTDLKPVHTEREGCNRKCSLSQLEGLSLFQCISGPIAPHCVHTSTLHSG